MARKKPPKYRGEQLLTRFLDFSYESKEVRPAHIALYAHILSLYNKLGWPQEFALPTETAMNRVHIHNKKTYYDTLKDLFAWGWIKDLGRNGRECRFISLLEGKTCQAFGHTLSIAADTDCRCAELKDEAPEKPQQEGLAPDMERFDRVFDAWSSNVANEDKRWVETMKRDTGIKDCKLAMSLFKEHIIRNSKVDAWLSMSLSERKSYFLNSSRYFADSDCKRKKEIIARVVLVSGKEYVEQYGARFPLPLNHKPQPDVNYYWDTIWNDWREA